jgi:parallel beta-helix repeat protein
VGDTGIIIDNCGEFSLNNLQLISFDRYGIWVRNNAFLGDIRGCRFAGNREAGLCLDHLEQGGRLGDYLPNAVADCTAFGGDTGILCNRAIVVNITGCQVFQTGKTGFTVRAVSNSVLISGCRTFKMEGDAVKVEQSHEINISSNTFCWQRGTGIVLSDVSWGTVSGNNVIDSGSECTGGPRAVGIILKGETRGIQVTGNAVFNWGGQGMMTAGIRETESCSHNQITNNNLNYFLEKGVDSRGTGSIAVDNIEIAKPAYLGSPDNPDPRFNIDAMNRYIRDLER